MVLGCPLGYRQTSTTAQGRQHALTKLGVPLGLPRHSGDLGVDGASHSPLLALPGSQQLPMGAPCSARISTQRSHSRL
eukprot:1542523-Pyramimonas_sp.AAC.1